MWPISVMLERDVIHRMCGRKVVRHNATFVQVFLTDGESMFIAPAHLSCLGPSDLLIQNVLDGEGHRDLFRLSHALQHGKEALVYSNHPREAAPSTSLAMILGRIVSGIPWLLRSTTVLMQLPCLTRDEWR